MHSFLSKQTNTLRILGAVLLVVATIMAGLQAYSGYVTDREISHAEKTVGKARKAAELFELEKMDASIALEEAQATRDNAERDAAFRRGSRSFFIGTIETDASIERKYRDEMDLAADEYNRVAEAFDEVLIRHAEAEVHLESENAALAELKEARESAGARQITIYISSAVIAAAALMIFLYSFRRGAMTGSQDKI